MRLRSVIKLDDSYLAELREKSVINFAVYVEVNENKLGIIKDILINDSGEFAYFIVDFGLWLFNKQVMLPVNKCRVDYEAQRVYVIGVDRSEAEKLPEYEEEILTADVSASDFTYQDAPDLYVLNDGNHNYLKQYQEQLKAKKQQEIALINQGIEIESVEAVIETQQDVANQSESNTELENARVHQPTRSACLIFNPVAGQTDAELDLETIKKLLETDFILDIRLTTPEIDADELAKEAVERGAEIIIASGGDGTLSAAAEAVVGTGIPLGVISRGTANAFATALGIPTTIEAACQTILDGIPRVVDAAYCNGRPMVLLAGIGFEAGAVERADRVAKNRFGMLAYVLAGFQELRNIESFATRIETEDKVITVDAAAVTIANAAPATSVLAQGPAELVVDDGLLDVTIVSPSNTIGAIAAAYNLLQSAYSNTTSERPDTGYLRAKSIKVETDPPQKVVVDGELIGNTPVTIECIPGGLTIIVPKVAEETRVEKLEGLPNLRIELKEPPTENE